MRGCSDGGLRLWNRNTGTATGPRSCRAGRSRSPRRRETRGGSVIPPSGVSLAWTHARHGQDVDLRSHEAAGLLIVLEGDAELTGALARRVQQGDVLTIPSGQPYGFRSIAEGGLSALHVAFGEAPEQANDDGAVSLKDVLARNEARANVLLNNNPFFLLLKKGTLESERKRTMMRESLRVFSDSYQHFLFARQALCRDETYRATFMEHLREELDHNLLLKVSGLPRAAQDPVLRATSTWFCHQMFVLDNAGKAALNIMLETAGYYFHTLAKPVFDRDESAEYFDIHAEADERHKEVGVEFLEGQHPTTYVELRRIVDEGWDKLDAMTRRVAYLVEHYASAS